jgi:putative addiction module killer protein
MKKIKLFQTDKGIKPFQEWLLKVKDIKDRARIRRRVDRLQLGHYGDYKQLKQGLYELRLFFGPGYRVYFTEQSGEIIILLLGGHKATQAPI